MLVIGSCSSLCSRMSLCRTPSRHYRADLSLTVWRTEMPHSTVRACGVENWPLKRKSPQKRLQSVSESLRLFSSNRVCADCGMLHNSDYDLCGTENGCAIRLMFGCHCTFFLVLCYHRFRSGCHTRKCWFTGISKHILLKQRYFSCVKYNNYY